MSSLSQGQHIIGCSSYRKLLSSNNVLYNEGSYHLLQESGKLILSFDGLFGLPRKTAAGSSYRKPLHGNLMFCEQSEVDLFVSAYPEPKKVTTVSVGSVQRRFFYYTKFALYFKLGLQ